MKIIIISFVLVICSCSIFKNKNNMVLNGSVTQAKLVNNKNFNWFDNEYKNYQPNIELVNQLKPLKEDLKVLIIAGTWCSDTQRELPRFFKIANTVGIPQKNIEIVMVNESKVCTSFNISVLEVTNVPTFIFFKDGKEQGRIIEKPKATLEEDICNLLSLM